MRKGLHLGPAVWTGAVLMAVAVSASAQDKSPARADSTKHSPNSKQQSPDPKPCSVIPDPDPCGTTPKAPAGGGSGAIDRFPFPGSGSAASSSAPAPSIGGPAESPQVPAAATQPSASPADANKKFPFPGGSALPSSSSAPSAPLPETGSSSSSSSSDNGDPADGLPADTPDLKDAGTEGALGRPGSHILHRAAPKVKVQTAEEREAEDLDVAKFYRDSGDLQGAYLRAQDAVKTAPDDPDAHFALAELAAKLGRKEEAIAEYNACLKLDPSDKEKKDSSKALARLEK